MRVIMTGGGTGGHIYPAIAIADELKKQKEDIEILFVGAEVGLEGDIVPANGYDIKLIPVEGFDRQRLHKNFGVILNLMRSNVQSKAILKEFKPDAVIGTGGYASAPVIKTAQKMGIPTYVHEQNAYPGMTNRMLEKKANKIFLGFEHAAEYFSYPEKHVLAGNPVRDEFANISQAEAKAALGFKQDEFVLLASGGSQGAACINNAMKNVIETFNGVENFKICLAAGSYYYKDILADFKARGIELKDNIIIMEYIHDMAKYLAAADLVVGRSGALTVAEVTMCGKPGIFIPFPYATGNHQYYNAKAVADVGGAVVIEENNLEDDTLVSEILKLKNNPEVLKVMAEKSASCAPLKATEIICSNVLEDIK